MSSIIKAFAVVVFACCALACSDDPTTTESDAAVIRIDAGDDVGNTDAGDNVDASSSSFDYTALSVLEPGPFQVGFRDWEITYDAVLEPGRPVRVTVWYPTEDTEGEAGRYFKLFRRPEVLADASVALDEPMPVLVFSHGNSGLAEQNYFMSEFLASHGWLVISPDHTGNTFRDQSVTFQSAPFRPQDITAVLDDLLSLPEDDPLHGLANPDYIAMSGHSFGGYTTLALTGATFDVDGVVSGCNSGVFPANLCTDFLGLPGVEDLFRGGFHDERFKVGIPMTPGGFIFFNQGLKEISVPTMLMTAGRDRTLPNIQEGNPIWTTMDGADDIRLDITAAGHFTFSNMCDFFGGVEPIRSDGCGDEFIEPELAFRVINAYVLAFMRFHMFDDQSVAGMIDGSENPYEGTFTYSSK